MAANELETQVGSADLTSLDASSLTDELKSSSSAGYQDPDIKAKYASTGLRRRLKRLRSNRVVMRLPSLKIVVGQDGEGTFPNYMKTTSSSTAKETLQNKSATRLTKQGSLKPGRSLIRLSSTRSRRTLTRRSFAGVEIKRKLNKSRSIKPGRGDLAEPSSSNQSMEVETRGSTLRPLRRLTKVASIRTRRPPLKNASQNRDLHAEKATCSSAIKDLKFPEHLDLEPGATAAEGIASVKVCPYSYCSLHGHHHASPSPLKGFVSMRRNRFNAPKSTESQSRPREGLKRTSGEGQIQVSHLTLNSDNTERIFTDGMRNHKVYSTRKSNHRNGARDSSSATESEVTKERHGEAQQEEVNVVGFNQNTVCSTIDAGDPAPTVNEDNASIDEADYSLNDTSSLENNVIVGKRSVGDVNPDLGTVIEEQLAESKEKNGNSVQDISDTTADVIPDHILDATHESPEAKNVSMWNLIYKKMVSGLAAEGEIQTAYEKAEDTDQLQRFDAFPGINISKQNQIGERDGEIQNMLLYQNDAIKIVQEAFDKILSEIPDQSSDDKSVDLETVSDKESEDKNLSEGTQLSISNLSSSLRDNTENHTNELGTAAASSKCLNGEPNEGRNLEKKDFKSWSTVKKILMMNRFVKALEKVKNANPRKPNILPVQPQSAAEKVNLRHLTGGNRKQSEEWMLDYVLQKVIGTLAPAQKRKVAMLVQAFQTIIPETNTPLTPSSGSISSSTTSVNYFTFSPEQRTSEKEKGPDFGAHLRKTAIVNGCFKQEDKLICSCAEDDHRLHTCSGSQETRSNCGFSEKKGSPIHKIVSSDPRSSNNLETEVNQHGTETSVQELSETTSIDKPSPEATNVLTDQKREVSSLDVPEEACPEPPLESQDLDMESNNQKIEGDNQIEKFEQSRGGEILSPEPLLEHSNGAPSDEPPETSVSETEAQLKGKFLQLFSSLDDSQPNFAREVAQENQLGKQMNTRLWYMIYKHMVSGSTTPLQGEYPETRDGENASTNHFGQQGSSEMNNVAQMGHLETEGLEQIEAIRLVEEAIDDIPFPETEEELRDGPPISPDKKHLIITEKLVEEGDVPTPIKTNYSSAETQEGSSIEGEEQGHEAKNSNTDKEVKREPSIEIKLKTGTLKRWSNVKKLILLQRFMKSMENVKKINTRPPSFIPLDPTEVAEKVNLRHQDIADKKSSDEWMLDYTLQRVVSKLTPARKRKVQLLVEAFETVIPPNWA